MSKSVMLVFGLIFAVYCAEQATISNDNNSLPTVHDGKKVVVVNEFNCSDYEGKLYETFATITTVNVEQPLTKISGTKTELVTMSLPVPTVAVKPDSYSPEVNGIFVEYMFSLENFYRYFNYTKINEDQDRITIFIEPIKRFSENQEKSTPQELKETLHNLAKYLIENNKIDESEFKGWKNSKVIPKDLLDKAIQLRSKMYSKIQEKNPKSFKLKRVRNLNSFQLSRYLCVIDSLDENEFKKLINSKIDWKLFTEQYVKLLNGPVSKNPASISDVRDYLVEFLRDGKEEKSKFEKLMSMSTSSSNVKYLNFYAILGLLALPLLL